MDYRVGRTYHPGEAIELRRVPGGEVDRGARSEFGGVGCSNEPGRRENYTTASVLTPESVR